MMRVLAVDSLLGAAAEAQANRATLGEYIRAMLLYHFNSTFTTIYMRTEGRYTIYSPLSPIKINTYINLWLSVVNGAIIIHI